MACYFAIRQLPMPQGAAWRPVIAPIACARIVIENSTNFSALVRTEGLDGNYKVIRANSELEIVSSVVTWYPDDPQPICEVAAPNGDTRFVISFFR